MHVLQAHRLHYSVKNKPILQNIHLQVSAGEFHVILGANGAGKSTLLKCLSGESTPAGGQVLFRNLPLQAWHSGDLARCRALLQQQVSMSMPFTAYEVIAMGRYPHYKHSPQEKDHMAIEAASYYTHTTGLWHRNYLTLSGGEQQRVQLARVIAQLYEDNGQAMTHKLLLMDEPISALDIKHQYGVLQMVRQLCGQGMAVVCILHDINIAMQFATHIHLMLQGSFIYQGEVCHLQEDMIETAFGIPVQLRHWNERSWVTVQA